MDDVPDEIAGRSSDSGGRGQPIVRGGAPCPRPPPPVHPRTTGGLQVGILPRPRPRCGGDTALSGTGAVHPGGQLPPSSANLLLTTAGTTGQPPNEPLPRPGGRPRAHRAWPSPRQPPGR